MDYYRSSRFALGRNRTSNHFFRKEVLYPLSYKCITLDYTIFYACASAGLGVSLTGGWGISFGSLVIMPVSSKYFTSGW